MSHNEQQQNVITRLAELGYTTKQIDIITNWWEPSEHYDWLMTASREEIDEASVEAFES